MKMGESRAPIPKNPSAIDIQDPTFSFDIWMRQRLTVVNTEKLLPPKKKKHMN